MFYDRIDAGNILEKKLKTLNLPSNETVVLGIPRGGVVVAAELATSLNLPLDILVAKKIAAPYDEEFAIGAVSKNEVIIQTEIVDKNYLENEIKLIRQEIERRLKTYRGNKKPINITNKYIVLVDDGAATGLTIIVGIKELKRYKPKKIIVAVPVISDEAKELILSEGVELVTLIESSELLSVGQFYENFPEILDEEVINILKLDSD